MAGEDLRENPFRDEIYNYLLSIGYRESIKADYDYMNAIDRAKLFEFLENSQKEQFERFKDTYKDNWMERFIKILNDKINNEGLLAALKGKLEDYQSSTCFSLAFFGSNIESMTYNKELYEKNIFSVRREFAYEDKQDSFRVDIAIFLNGIPIIMIELKKQTTGQKAGFEGTSQFRNTRNPNELVFSINKLSLIHISEPTRPY